MVLATGDLAHNVGQQCVYNAREQLALQTVVAQLAALAATPRVQHTVFCCDAQNTTIEMLRVNDGRAAYRMMY